MKRLLVLMLLIVLSLTALTTQAQAFDPTQLAQYFPENTDIYAGLRIDDGYLETLDGALTAILNKLPEELASQVPPITLRQALLSSLPAGVTYEGIRQWLGDYAAFGAANIVVTMDDDVTNDDEAITYAAVALKDRAGFEAFLLEQIPDLAAVTPITADSFTIYSDPEGDGLLAFNNDVAIFTDSTEVPTGGLGSSAAFTSTYEKLPADSYNIFMYVNSAVFASVAQSNIPAGLEQNPFELLNVDFANLAPFAFGFTVLDGRTLAIDVVSPTYSNLMPALTPVDPAFASLIPADISYVGHFTDLGGNLDAALNIAAVASEETNNPMSMEQISNLFNGLTGLDLQDDVLSWMTGDAALIADTDIPGLLGSMMTGTMDELPLSFGFIVETNGSDRPAAVVATLGRLLRNQGENNADMTVTEETINGVNVVVVTGEAAGLANPIEFVIGADNRLFVAATRPLAEQLFSGDYAGLDTTAAYQEAAQYILPNSGTVLYTDNVFIGDMVTGALFFVVSNTGAGNSDLSDMTPMIRFAYDLVSSTSISTSTLASGDSLSRMVLTLAR